MIRRLTYAAALTLTIVLCGTISAGPAFADEPEPPAPSVVQPDPTPTNPTPTTEPAPDPVQPAEPAEPSEPSPAAPTDEALPDLRVSAEYDKTTYDTRDQICIRIRLVNVGSAPATGLTERMSADLLFGHWEQLVDSGATFGPGASAEAFRCGMLSKVDSELVVRTRIEVVGRERDANPADNVVTITAPLTQVRGNVEGFVYGDRNRNNVVDPGELLGGVTVTINRNGGPPLQSFSQETDSQGRFAFRDIPAGIYSTGFSLAGWSIPSGQTSVDGVDDPNLVIRATRLLSETLKASMAFAKDTYSETETAHLIVTLNNSGSVPLTGIIGYCIGFGSNDWGGLADYSSGVTVPARSKRIFDVAGPIPEPAAAGGSMSVHCEFVLIGVGVQGVVATASARVPGRVASEVHSSLRRLVAYPGCPPIAPCGGPSSFTVPDTKVYIRSPFNGRIVARAVTNRNGEFQFANLPVGQYDFGIVGPWKIAPGSSPFHVYADADNVGRANTVYVVPGPNQADPDAVTPVPPVPQAGVGPAGDTEQLAWTGVNVIWLAIGGLLSLVTGFVLVLRGVRRNLPLAG
jgi:hypothetical protein